MGTNWTQKALLEVIPPWICITFRRASFWFRPKNSKSRLWDGWAENTINSGPGSHDNCSEKVEYHEHRLELDPYSTNRAENQGFWISKVLPIRWDSSRPQQLQYKIQNRAKIQRTPPGKVYTKLFRQPYHLFQELLMRPPLEVKLAGLSSSVHGMPSLTSSTEDLSTLHRHGEFTFESVMGFPI